MGVKHECIAIQYKMNGCFVPVPRRSSWTQLALQRARWAETDILAFTGRYMSFFVKVFRPMHSKYDLNCPHVNESVVCEDYDCQGTCCLMQKQTLAAHAKTDVCSLSSFPLYLSHNKTDVFRPLQAATVAGFTGITHLKSSPLALAEMRHLNLSSQQCVCQHPRYELLWFLRVS